jgi:flagellar protein FlaJ
MTEEDAFSVKIKRFALKHFEKQAEKLLPFLHWNRALERGGVRTYAVAYVSVMIFFLLQSLLIAALGVVLTVCLSLWFFPLVLAPLFVFLGYFAYPFVKASERGEKLTPEVPFTITYTSIMGAGGVSPYTSFKRLTQAELLPASREEAKRLVYQVEVMGEDPLTAFKKAAETTPSPSFTAFLRGYIDTTITSGNVKHYLQVKMEEALRDRSAQLKIVAERLSTLLEGYMAVSVMLGIVFYLMWATGGLLGSGGMGEQMFYLYVSVFTPLFAALFVWLANAMQPKRPFADWSTYKVAAGSFGIAVAVFAMLFWFGLFDLTIQFGIATLVFTLPAAIEYSKISRENSGVEKGITAFLRDYTEARKTGLAPEKAISELSRYNYGEFSKHLKRINWLIETGVPTREAINIFMRKTKSWLGKVYMYLLIETIDVGGATISTSEALASFASSTEAIEKEKKMTMKMAIGIPYVMVVMFLVVVEMLISMLGGMALPFISNMEWQNIVLTLAVMLNSVCAGFVTGKITEETAAAGFKHIFVMILICLAVSTIMGVFF